MGKQDTVVCKYCGILVKQIRSHLRTHHNLDLHCEEDTCNHEAKIVPFPGIRYNFGNIEGERRCEALLLNDGNLYAHYRIRCNNRGYLFEDKYQKLAPSILRLNNLNIPSIVSMSNDIDDVSYTSSLVRYRTTDTGTILSKSIIDTQKIRFKNDRDKIFSLNLDTEEDVEWYLYQPMSVSRGSVLTKDNVSIFIVKRDSIINIVVTCDTRTDADIVEVSKQNLTYADAQLPISYIYSSEYLVRSSQVCHDFHYFSPKKVPSRWIPSI